MKRIMEIPRWNERWRIPGEKARKNCFDRIDDDTWYRKN
jgi:hypothetical protein